MFKKSFIPFKCIVVLSLILSKGVLSDNDIDAYPNHSEDTMSPMVIEAPVEHADSDDNFTDLSGQAYVDELAALRQSVQQLKHRNFAKQFDLLRKQLADCTDQISQQKQTILNLQKQVEKLGDQLQQFRKMPVKSNPGVPVVDKNTLYEQGVAAMQQKKYSESQNLMQQYLKRAPKGKFVANVYFWLGELALIQHQYQSSASAFKRLVQQFPAFEQTPNAMLKLAMITKISGNFEQSRHWLTELIAHYPDTSAALIAQQQLDHWALG